ncbi:hypothetical protein QJS10_CPA07g01076 [Acorus calamus]|uniref:prephenate dehydratase n=1 Tax=Acorus calamus TaxID=4465 RepID=A0AAV9EGT3_ACOCL|nr:hypothetical protein QJS10_CPA07g01076 [Acorus calamus]
MASLVLSNDTTPVDVYFGCHGNRLRVAYQGVEGAYSESAAMKAYPNYEPIPCEHFETVFEVVEHELVDRAVLPFENSLGGSIHRNYDLILRHKLHIIGEVRLSIRHCLMANHGVKLDDLKRVLKHPQGLAQCEHMLTKLGVAREAVDDIVGAAQFMASHQLQDTGVVASSKAAEIYGLNILARDIQDKSDNVTRFFMLARDPVIPRTDMPFKIESRPGGCMPLRGANDNANGILKYFEYFFHLELEASTTDQNTKNALVNLEDFSSNSITDLMKFYKGCQPPQHIVQTRDCQCHEDDFL